jgi:hypothetical protein
MLLDVVDDRLTVVIILMGSLQIKVEKRALHTTCEASNWIAIRCQSLTMLCASLCGEGPSPCLLPESIAPLALLSSRRSQKQIPTPWKRPMTSVAPPCISLDGGGGRQNPPDIQFLTDSCPTVLDVRGERGKTSIMHAFTAGTQANPHRREVRPPLVFHYFQRMIVLGGPLSLWGIKTVHG